MQQFRAVDADANVDVLLREEITPCVVNQDPIGLKRMRDCYSSWLLPINHAERFAIKFDRHHHRLAGMPYHRQAVLEPTGCKYLREQIRQGRRSDHRFRIPIWQITIPTIDIAERRWLNNQQLYSRHEGARGLTSPTQPTNSATNCSNCSS